MAWSSAAANRGESGMVGAAIASPRQPPPKNRASERGVRGSQSFLSHLRTHPADKAPADNGESFWLESNHAAPQKLSQLLLSGFGPCSIDARGAASMGTGAAVPGSAAEATQPRHGSHATGQGQLPGRQAGRQCCQHPPEPHCCLGTLCPPAWAALALPWDSGPSCSSGAAPG